MQVKESRKQKGKRSLEEQVLADLDAHTPWNRIAKKHHISSKTIVKIRDEAGFSGEGAQMKAVVSALVGYLYKLENLLYSTALDIEIKPHEVSNATLNFYEDLFKVNPSYARELVDTFKPSDHIWELGGQTADPEEGKLKDKWLRLMAKYYPEDIPRLTSLEE